MGNGMKPRGARISGQENQEEKLSIELSSNEKK